MISRKNINIYRVVFTGFLLLVFLFTQNLDNRAFAARGKKEKDDMKPVFRTGLEPIDVPESGFSSITLDNGMRILARENPGSQTVALEIIIWVGAMEAMDTNGGITSLIQRMILRGGGMDKHISLQESVEADGGMINASAEEDYVRISLLTTRDKFEEHFLRLISVLKKPDFSEKSLEEEKKSHIYMIQNSISAFNMMNEIFLKNFYRFHPYRTPIYGSKYTVIRMSGADVDSFYRSFYTADRMTIAVAGNFHTHQVFDLAKKNLSDIPSGKRKIEEIPWDPVAQEKKLELSTAAKTAWLFAGYPAPAVNSPDYPAVVLLNAILGQGLSSRLFIELREKEGLSYELSSFYPELTGPSHMIIYVVTNQKNLYKCRRKMLDEVKLLKKEMVSEDELEAVKRKVLGKYLISQESCAGQAFTAAYYASLGMGDDYGQVLMKRIQKVTPQQIKFAANKYFQNSTILTIDSVRYLPGDDDD